MKLVNLRRIRKSRFITREMLAYKASCSTRTIDYWESGRSTTINFARRVARELNVTIDELTKEK